MRLLSRSFFSVLFFLSFFPSLPLADDGNTQKVALAALRLREEKRERFESDKKMAFPSRLRTVVVIVVLVSVYANVR